MKSGGEDGEEKADESADRKRKYFVRGLIHIPTLATASSSARDEKAEGEGEGLTWGVWVRVSEDVFKWIVTNWDKEGRENDDKAKGAVYHPVTPVRSANLTLHGLPHGRVYGRDSHAFAHVR